MPIAFRGAATATGNSAASVTIPRPTGVLQGDLLIASWALADNVTRTPPSGWTQLRVDVEPSSPPAILHAVYYKVAGSSEPADYTWTAGVGTDQVVTILAYEYATVDGAVHDGAAMKGQGSPLSAPTVAVPDAGWLVLSLFVVESQNVTVDTPAGTTSRASVALVTGVNMAVRAVDETTTASGTVGRSATFNDDGKVFNAAAATIALAPFNTAPNAPTLTAPADGSALNRQQDQVFAWQFNDPDPGDSQSAYNFAYRLVGATTWTETGWVALTSSQHVVSAGTFAAGDYEWRVYTKDAQGEPSPPSATGFFTAGDPPPAPSITDPANNATIGTDEYTVVWSTPDQDAYRLRVLDGTVVVYDTGQVNSATARSRVVAFPDNNVTRIIELTVLSGGLWSPASTVTVTVSYTPPPVPWVTATPVDVGGGVPSAIRVDVEHPRLRLDATNLVTNPSGEATSGTVEVRRNLADNPSGEADGGWLSNSSTQLPVTWDTTIFRSGSRSRRSELAAGQTSNVCLSLCAVGDSSSAILPITAGETYTFSCYVRPGQAGYYSEARIHWYDASGVEITPRPTVTTAELPPGEWTRVSVSGTAPVGATGRRNGLFLRAVSGNATPGHFGHVDDALFEKSSVVGDYFDGSYSPDPDLTPEWTGATNASEARLMGPAPVGWTGAYYSASRDRIAALPAGATYTLAADPGPATLVVETETDTLHTPHTGTLVTVTEPYFRAAVVPGDYTGPYFDGDTPSDGEFSHRWTGTPHASTSERVHYDTTGELAASDDPTAVGMDVWIREAGDGDGIRLAADVPPSQPVTWHLPASGVEYEARARAIGENGTSTWSAWSA